jgi:hypothetical protein
MTSEPEGKAKPPMTAEQAAAELEAIRLAAFKRFNNPPKN